MSIVNALIAGIGDGMLSSVAFKHKIQKMNTIFLTDGCGHNMTNTVTTTDQGDLIVDDGRFTNSPFTRSPKSNSNMDGSCLFVSMDTLLEQL